MNMKNLWSKNSLIAFLVFTNTGTAAFFMAKKWGKPESVPSATAAAEKDTEKKGTVKAPPFKSNQGDLQACYETYLKSEPKVDEGAVTVHWRIGHDGQPEFLKLVHSDLQDATFNDCVLSKIKSSRFAERHGGALVAHTFNFHRKSPARLDF